MTLKQIIDFAEANGISLETEVSMETGIDVFIDVGQCVYDGVSLNLVGGLNED